AWTCCSFAWQAWRSSSPWWRCCCPAASARCRPPCPSPPSSRLLGHPRGLVGGTRQAAIEPAAGSGEGPEIELDGLGPAADRGKVEIGHGELRAQQIVAA